MRPTFPHVGNDVPEFVAPGDSMALSESLVRLLSDEDRVADMARRGAVHAEKFGWDTIVSTYLEMYHNAAFI